MRTYDELRFAWIFQGGPGTFLDAIMQAVEGSNAGLSDYLREHTPTAEQNEILANYQDGLFKRPRGRPALCPVRRGPEFAAAEKLEQAARMVKSLKPQLKALNHPVRGRHKDIVKKVADHFGVSEEALLRRINEGKIPRRERKPRI